MNRILASKVKVQGLSKNKIMLASLLVACLLLLAMLWGIFDQPSIKDNDSKDNWHLTTDSLPSANQIIDKINQNKAKVMASATKELNPQIKSLTAWFNPQASSGVSIEVPPIQSRQTLLQQQEVPTRHHVTLKKINDKHNSFTAKSLMFNAFSVQAMLPLPSITTSAPKQELINQARPNQKGNDASNTLPQNINNNKNDNNYLAAQLYLAQSPYELKAGSIIPATMISGLNSDLPGQVIAQVRQNVYDSSTRRYLLIPQGAKLVGIYDSHIAYGQNRIMVAWNRLIYPNGNSIDLQGMPGSDLEGYAGFHDKVDNHYWKIFGMSFIMGVITAGMQYSQNNINTNVQSGGLVSNPTIGQTLSGSLGQQLGQTGLSITQKNLNVQPTLIISPNYPFSIMLTADIILKPYKF